VTVSLKDIDKSNFWECIKLTTNKEGKRFLSEKFVASNAVSIAESKIYDFWITKAIYAGEIMVGFAMYGYCPDDELYELCRFMIDHKHQGRGYGRRALELIIEEMKQIYNPKEIYLSFVPGNERAKKLYEIFGFKDTGKIEDGEIVYCLSIDK